MIYNRKYNYSVSNKKWAGKIVMIEYDFKFDFFYDNKHFKDNFIEVKEDFYNNYSRAIISDFFMRLYIITSKLSNNNNLIRFIKKEIVCEYGFYFILTRTINVKDNDELQKLILTFYKAKLLIEEADFKDDTKDVYNALELIKKELKEFY